MYKEYTPLLKEQLILLLLDNFSYILWRKKEGIWLKVKGKNLDFT